MNRMPQLLLSLAVSIVVAGCGREKPKTETEQVGTGTPTARDPVATRGTRDAGFIREQLAVGDKQVGLARLASERATRPAVRKFGEMMLRDYRQASEELRQIASRQQVNAGAENEQLKVERERLSRLSGSSSTANISTRLSLTIRMRSATSKTPRRGTIPRSPMGGEKSSNRAPSPRRGAAAAYDGAAEGPL